METTFIDLMDDMHLSDEILFKQYYDAMVNNNISEANSILSNNPQLANQIMNADNINYIINAINERELQPKTEIDYFLENLLNEFQKLIDNTKDMGLYDDYKKYFSHNCVIYNSQTYFCLSDETPVGTLPSDTRYWIEYELKGLQGYGGILNMSYKGNWNSTTQYSLYDLVVYQNKLWWAIAPNTNFPPNINHYPWILVAFAKPATKTTIQTSMPSGYDEGSFWFEIITGTDIVQTKWDTLSGETIPRYASASFKIGNNVYIVGGANSSFAPTNNNEVFDTVTQTWSIKASLPIALHGMSGFTINNIGYCVGGVTSSLTYVDSVYSYNPSTNTWTQKNNFPKQVDIVNGSVVIGNFAYIAGFNTNTGYTNEIYKYNSTNDTWSLEYNLPTIVGGCSLAAINNNIYIISGINENANLDNKTYIYNTTTHTVSTGSNMPNPRILTAVFVKNNNIYIVGGADKYLYSSNIVEIYNTSNNTWTEEIPMLTNRMSCCGAYDGNYGYVFGGINIVKPEILSSTERYTF